jgi:hypothetical protein
LFLVRPAIAMNLPWEIWESPARLATLDANDLVLERSSHCLDGCRYDRSNPGSEDPATNPYPLRWLYVDGEEAVMFDERGPGAVTRLWITGGFEGASCIDPAIRVRFYLDGAAQPTLDVPLVALFDGTMPPFTPPLVADAASSSGGYTSHVPIAYSTSLKIALVGAGNGGVNPCTGNARRLLWFQIQHHRLAPGTPVESFNPSIDFPEWRAFLAHAGDDPWNGMLAPIEAASKLDPGATIELASRAGTGWLRGLRITLDPSNYRKVRLVVDVDGAVAIDAPLGDFFASAPEMAMAPRGVFAGEDASGWLYAWLPIPYRASVQVQLVASASLAAPVTIGSELTFDSAPVPDTAGSFEAAGTDACVAAGDITLYDHAGAGRIVGVAARYSANGVPNLAYLEGDERVYADGAITPAWYGTGVEDFFGGGFYFNHGAFARALAGATLVDTDGAVATSAYRWMPTDSIVHSGAVRVALEPGLSPSSPVPTCAHALVYTYRRTRADVVVYDAFDAGGALAAAHSYVAPPSAICADAAGAYEDEPPTQRSATTCTYDAGTSRFRFDVATGASPLRLRRTFDGSGASPGIAAGAPAAEIHINGVLAGRFPPAIANPARRWQEQDALIDPSIDGGALDIEIVPEFTAFAPSFAESRWTLLGAWKDELLADGFE